jgi:hypothetical protein
MSGVRFVDPPASIFRPRPFFDPGLLALAGAGLAVAFLMFVIGMLESGLGITLGDLIRRLPVAR